MSKIVTCRADLEYMVKFLCSLPSDVIVHVNIQSGRTQKLMARDRPGEGRRFTNLTSGTEWFMTPEGLENIGVIDIAVESFTLTRWYN